MESALKINLEIQSGSFFQHRSFLCHGHAVSSCSIEFRDNLYSYINRIRSQEGGKDNVAHQSYLISIIIMSTSTYVRTYESPNPNPAKHVHGGLHTLL